MAGTPRVLTLTDQGWDAIAEDAAVPVNLADLVQRATDPPWDRAFFCVNLETKEGALVMTRNIKPK